MSVKQPRERISQAIAALCRRKGSNGLKPDDLKLATVKELNAIAALGDAWTKLCSDELETRADTVWMEVERVSQGDLLRSMHAIMARQKPQPESVQ